MEHNFWVEVFIKTPGTNAVTDSLKTCPALAVASPARNGA
jgi:hypothetical protein